MEKKKRVKVSEYLGRIDENGLVEKNNRSIFEFGNSELLMTMAWDLVPELKRHFPDHWKEIIAMSVVRVMDNQPLRLIKSRWEKLHASGCTVHGTSGQIAKRIKIRFLPFHLPFVLPYFFPSSIALPSRSLPP